MPSRPTAQQKKLVSGSLTPGMGSRIGSWFDISFFNNADLLNLV
ncbi:hypothetical protein KM92DES2_11808 [uncultured Desulfovibrio sp.]|uniref:Uncharacterized protein n=1 Tax=uncultured Desulfovibrio sp. TaxID=167968 RepID=A0A212JVP5_9BACT|nr:hypothetical protein KM92DES2_11808 [uncultured Desulfovibrio sp.]